MEILENADAWTEHFETGWLEHLHRTGTIDWGQYRYARNRTPVVAAGLDPASARLLLVSTAGAYVSGVQAPFDAANPLGDYSIRAVPAIIPFDELDYAHDHYDHAARRQDPRVNLPLGYLADMVDEGSLGELADTVVSYSGYHPDANGVVEATIPEVLRVAVKEQAQAVLLVPV